MTTSLWLDRPGRRRAPLTGAAEADVVIVGAGVCGAAAALALSAQGLRVRWLEASGIASGATGRNAGFILQGNVERYDRAVALLGRERARAIHALTLDNHRRMREVIDALHIDCAYRQAGSLQLANGPEEAEELVRSAALLAEDGFEAQLLAGAELPAVYREAGFEVAVHMVRDGELDPVAFVRGAAAGAEAAGVILHEDSPVLDIDELDGGEVRVRTEGGELRASMALVCGNAWTGTLLPWFKGKVEPVRGQMLATEPAPRIFDLPVYADHGYDYWRQTPEGRLVLGGWRNLDPGAEVGYEDRLHDDIQLKMTRFLDRFPGLGGPRISHRWSGIMGFSQDGLPIVGPAPGSGAILAAAGFTGHGFGFAWRAGELLASAVAGASDPDAALLSPARLR
jgi:glycine/D-amino acid oxidase-like deaminating enzyme